MDEALINRHNIVEYFFEHMKELQLDTENSTIECSVFSVENKFQIKRFVKDNKYVFSMFITGFIEEQVFEDYHNNFTPNSFGPRTVQKSIRELVEVMEYNNGSFNMVNAASNNNWIYHDIKTIMCPNGYSELKNGLFTNMNESFRQFPNTEEMHFQQCTVSPLVLELEYCLKVYDIMEYVNSFGSVVMPNPNLKVQLLFNRK